MAALVIDTIPCTTAREFLERLSPFSETWQAVGGVGRWIFRGQAGEWPLSPAAMRDDAFIYDGVGCSTSVVPRNLEDQLREEMNAVMRFVRACIRAGLPLPEDSQWLRSESLQRATFHPHLLQLTTKGGVDAPFPLLRSLFALAQHHQVPTRLLDWTADPMIAAYFACEGIARWRVDPKRFPPKTTPSDKLVVWALRSATVFDHMADHYRREKSFEPLLEMVEAPYRDNPRLAAQKGVFTLLVYKTVRGSNDFRLPALEDVLRKYELSRYASADARDDWPLARSLTLPHSEARRLLRLLGEADVNASSVFRDYDGARVSLEELRFWE